MQKENENMAKEIALNLKISEEMADLLGKATYQTDKNKSCPYL